MAPAESLDALPPPPHYEEGEQRSRHEASDHDASYSAATQSVRGGVRVRRSNALAFFSSRSSRERRRGGGDLACKTAAIVAAADDEGVRGRKGTRAVIERQESEGLCIEGWRPDERSAGDVCVYLRDVERRDGDGDCDEKVRRHAAGPLNGDWDALRDVLRGLYSEVLRLCVGKTCQDDEDRDERGK